MTLGFPRPAFSGKTEATLTPMKPSPPAAQAGIRSSVAVSPGRSMAWWWRTGATTASRKAWASASTSAG